MTSLPADAMLTLGGVLTRLSGLLGGSLIRAAIAGAIAIAGGIAVDSGAAGDGTAALNFLLSFVIMFLQYWLIFTLIDELGLKRSGGGRFAGYFALGIVTTLGILLGFALLVVPGLILAARWSLASPALIASDKGVFEALGESWQATKGRSGVIVGAMLVIYLLPIVLIVAGGVLLESLRLDLAGIVMGNIGFGLWLVGGSYLSAALYSLLAGPDSFSTVFE